MTAGVVAVVFRLLAGVAPVLLFLAALLLLDSWKLVTRRAVLRSIAWGMAAAAIAFALNAALLTWARLDPLVLKRYAAPIVEESLKAALLVGMIRGGRVGFLVDAAIHGFAAGTGFALVENAYYAGSGASGLALWIVRGLGTAVMHGSATAIAGILAKSLSDRFGGAATPRWLVPAVATAAVVHSLYNHLLLSPLLVTAGMIALLPLLVAFVFERSERATAAWIGEGLDSEVELLELIASGEFRRTHAGAYLEALRQRFPGPVVADMLCWLQIRLELAVRAKGLLLARAAGVDLPVDPDVRANFTEMEFLEKSIGPTGKLALLPLVRGSARDLWQLRLLAERG
ncbi:MAG: PrsW family glutamic-type intramembrane protease [Bacteroidota bacterium]